MTTWEVKLELFGHPRNKKSRWVLYDPAGIIRAVFRGLGSDAAQRDLAKTIAQLLNEFNYEEGEEP